MNNEDNPNETERSYARFPIERIAEAKPKNQPGQTQIYQFPAYATEKYGSAFKEGITRLIRCIKGIESGLEVELINLQDDIERLFEWNKQEVESFNQGVSKYLSMSAPHNEEFRFIEWLNGIDEIAFRYSHNPRCVKRAIRVYCQLASNSNYANNIFTRKAFLDRAEDAVNWLRPDPGEKDFVKYVIKSIKKQRKKPFS